MRFMDAWIHKTMASNKPPHERGDWGQGVGIEIK